MNSPNPVNPRQAPLALGDLASPPVPAAGRSPTKRRTVPKQVPHDRFLRLGDVLHLTGFSRSTLYRLLAQGVFPTSVPISVNAVAWLESEVLAWMAGRAAIRGKILACGEG